MKSETNHTILHRRRVARELFRTRLSEAIQVKTSLSNAPLLSNVTVDLNSEFLEDCLIAYENQIIGAQTVLNNGEE